MISSSGIEILYLNLAVLVFCITLSEAGEFGKRARDKESVAVFGESLAANWDTVRSLKVLLS